MAAVDVTRNVEGLTESQNTHSVEPPFSRVDRLQSRSMPGNDDDANSVPLDARSPTVGGTGGGGGDVVVVDVVDAGGTRGTAHPASVTAAASTRTEQPLPQPPARR